jgi:hypothetical protein
MLSSAVQHPPIAMVYRPEGYQREEGLHGGDDCTLLDWKAAVKGRLRASLNILTGVEINKNAVSRKKGLFC